MSYLAVLAVSALVFGVVRLFGAKLSYGDVFKAIAFGISVLPIVGMSLFFAGLVAFALTLVPALGNRVGPRRSERRARLGNTEITYPPIEAGAITVRHDLTPVYDPDETLGAIWSC